MAAMIMQGMNKIPPTGIINNENSRTTDNVNIANIMKKTGAKASARMREKPRIAAKVERNQNMNTSRQILTTVKDTK